MEVAHENLRKLRNTKPLQPRDDDTDGNGPPGAGVSGGTAGGIQSVVADKGYNKAEVLRQMKENGYCTYIPEQRQKGTHRWTDKGGRQAAIAFYEN